MSENCQNNKRYVKMSNFVPKSRGRNEGQRFVKSVNCPIHFLLVTQIWQRISYLAISFAIPKFDKVWKSMPYVGINFVFGPYAVITRRLSWDTFCSTLCGCIFIICFCWELGWCYLSIKIQRRRWGAEDVVLVATLTMPMMAIEEFGHNIILISFRL